MCRTTQERSRFQSVSRVLFLPSFKLMGILPFSCEMIPFLSGLHEDVNSREAAMWFCHRVPTLAVLGLSSVSVSELWERPNLVPSPVLSSPQLCGIFPYTHMGVNPEFW